MPDEMEELRTKLTRLGRRVASVEEDHDDLRRDVREDIRGLRDEMRRRFDTVDLDHASVRRTTEGQTRWLKIVSALATLLGALGLFISPIVVAVISS